MSEMITAGLLQLVLFGTLGLAVWAFVVRLRGLRAGRLSRGRAIFGYLGWTISPALAFVAVFFALVGIEEVTGAALIGEGLGRSFLLVVGLSLSLVLVGGTAFAVTAWLAGGRSGPGSGP
jgi:hypothetical protein